MKINKLSIAVLFLSGSVFYAQEIKKDTLKSEKNIEGVQLRGNSNKKTEAAVLGEQKKAIIQKQAVSAEEISRKGISNVEQGLTKVTGITTVQGKGIFVRGLEERYNTLLINGLGSPSNNPFQKIIALKQFPTDVVGKLNIYKTFNSNLYGDFAGATFDIETLTIDKAFSKIEFSVGVNTTSSFRDNFKVNENANSLNGFVGLNSRQRQIPNEVRDYKPSFYNFSQQQSLHSFKEGWNVDNVKSLPNTSFGFTTVQKFKAGENGNLGFLLSLNQGQNYEYKEGANNLFRNIGVGDYDNKLNRKEYSYNIESSLLLGLAYKNKGTNINLNGIFLQNSENTIQDNYGFKDGGQTLKNGFFRVNQQDISRFLDIQLSASQKINERHFVKAGGSWVKNSFQQPDRKIFFGSTENMKDGEISVSYGGNNLIRQYLDVNGKNYFSAFAEYNINLGEKGDRRDFPLQLAIGYNGFADIRNTSYRFIYAKNTSSAGDIINIDKPQQNFENAIINGTYVYNEGSGANFKNNIYQFVNAGYLNVNYKPNDSWDILLGARAENSMNITRYKEQGMLQEDPMINLAKNKTYFLPSLSLKKALNSKSNLRFAFSKTITRPILIEYMPIQYINPDNQNVFGNEKLVNSENFNFDLKYELYPTNKELLAVNLFAKKIDKAIERSFVTSGNSGGNTITFYNADYANIAGIELEGILDLNRLSESLDKFSVGANATFMYSDVKRSANQAKETDVEAGRKRTLQGAAPWTVNADIKYEYKNSKNFAKTLSLVYNVSGKKIYGVGFSQLDNVYEMPFHQLDFVYNNQIDKNWNIKFAIQNILNSEYKLELGDKSLIQIVEPSLIMENYKKGTTFNLSVGYTF